MAETPTFTWMMPEMDVAPFSEDWPVLQAIQEQAGVNLKITVSARGDEYNTKVNAMIAAGEIPDIIFVSGNALAQIVQTGPDGAFLPLTDLIKEHAPEMQKLLDDFPSIQALAGNAVDEKIYIFPEFDLEPGNYRHQWYLREDLQEKYGIADPKTPDEFYEALKAFKEKHPDVYPLTAKNDSWGWDSMPVAFMMAFTGTNALDNIYGYNYDADAYILVPEHKNFKEMLLFVSKLYAEELLDPEWPINDRSKVFERLANDRAFAYLGWRTHGLHLEAQVKKNDPDSQFKLFAMPPFSAPGIEPYIVSKDPVQHAGFAISKKVKDPVAAVKLLNFLCTQAGIELTNFGAEGVSFTRKDGKIVPLEGGWGDSETSNNMVRNIGARYLGLRIAGIEELAPINERTQARNSTIVPYLRLPEKLVPLTPELNSLKKKYDEDIRTYAIETLLAFMTGQMEITDKNIQKMIDQLNKMKANEIIEQLNTVYAQTYK